MLQESQLDSRSEIDRLMEQYGNSLLRMSALYLKDADLAQDAVQEIFIKAYRHLNDYREESSESVYQAEHGAASIYFLLLEKQAELFGGFYTAPFREEYDKALAIAKKAVASRYGSDALEPLGDYQTGVMHQENSSGETGEPQHVWDFMIMVVIIEPVINITFYIFEAIPVCHPVCQFVLHVSVEAFLRSIVPTVSAARHALPKSQIVNNLNELHAGIVAALIRMDEYEAIIMTALFTGMRSGELLGLTWDCVDFENGLIRVTKQLLQPRRKGRPFEYGTPKNGKGRTLTPAPFVMDVLREHKKAQASQRLAVGPAWDDGGFPNLVFTHPDGNHLSQPTIWKALQKILKKAGLENHRFHDLRHH